MSNTPIICWYSFVPSAIGIGIARVKTAVPILAPTTCSIVFTVTANRVRYSASISGADRPVISAISETP